MSRPLNWFFTDIDQMKLFLGILFDTDTHNELLQMLINSSSSYIENYCDRRLKSTAYDKDVAGDKERTWFDGDNSKRLFLREYPVTAVSAVEVSGATISAAESTDYYGSTGYLLYEDRGELFYDSGWDVGKKNVRVSYTAGYTEDSRQLLDLRELCQGLVAWTFNNREHLGFKSERLLNYSYTRADIREKWQKETLERYKRKVIR